MKNFLICLILYFSSPYNLSAQSWQIATKGGGDLSDKATSIAIDPSGNTYITGYVNESGTFGPFSVPFINPSSKEVFVAKIDPNGNYLWVKSGENFFDDRGLGICLDPAGNVFITGTCWGGIVFDGISSYCPGSYTDQIFVVKLDNNGNVLFVKNAGTEGFSYPYTDDHGHSLISDNLGNIFVTGFISNNDAAPNVTKFDGVTYTFTTTSDSLAFLAKMDNSGNWIWLRTFGGEDGSYDNRMAIDSENNIYIAGGFRGTETFGTQTLTSNSNSSDIYVVKYDKDGNFIYVRTAGSSLDDRANDISVGSDNHVYMTGEFRDKVPFGTDTLNNYGGASGRDIFVSRMTSNGDWKWAKRAGATSGSDRGCGITTNNKHNIFVCGQFRGNAKFGSNDSLVSTDSVQVFVAAIDTLGKWKWALQGGGPFEDRACDIAVDTSCNVYTTGFYVSSGTFGSAAILPGNNKRDAFWAKIEDACFGYDQAPDPESMPEIAFSCEPLNSNVFSPNSDGVNDYYVFANSCVVKNFELVIVNRWGNVVHESNDPLEKWYGINKSGKKVSEGVYFIRIKYDLNLGKTIEYQSYVSIFE